jgi:hypothetical protein
MFGGEDVDFAKDNLNATVQLINNVIKNENVVVEDKAIGIQNSIKNVKVTSEAEVVNNTDTKMTTFNSQDLVSIPFKIRNALRILREGEENFSNIDKLHVQHMFVTGTPMTEVKINQEDIDPLKYDEDRLSSMLETFDNIALNSAKEVLTFIKSKYTQGEASALEVEMDAEGIVYITGNLNGIQDGELAVDSRFDEVLSKYNIQYRKQRLSEPLTPKLKNVNSKSTEELQTQMVTIDESITDSKKSLQDASDNLQLAKDSEDSHIIDLATDSYTDALADYSRKLQGKAKLQDSIDNGVDPTIEVADSNPVIDPAIVYANFSDVQKKLMDEYRMDKTKGCK